MNNVRQKYEQYMNNITPRDVVAIVHHTDTDGISSAVLINKIVSQLRNKPIDVRINQKPDQCYLTDETVHQLRQVGATKVIITDLAVDQYKLKNIRELEQFTELLIIDHHELYQDLNSEKTVMVKPQLLSGAVIPSMYCTVKLVNDISTTLVDLAKYDWIVALGMIGDSTTKFWQSFMWSVYHKYSIEDHADPFQTVLGQAADTLFFTQCYNINKVGECYRVLDEANHVVDIVNSPLQFYKQEVEKEIAYWKENVAKYAEVFPYHELIFDYIKPRCSIRSAISSSISERYPHKTVIIVEDLKDDFLYLSMRRGDGKVAINAVIENVVEHLHQAVGGGHARAAGGRLRREDFYRFKQLLLEKLEALMPQYHIQGGPERMKGGALS